jgi:hypothetical protein
MQPGMFNEKNGTTRESARRIRYRSLDAGPLMTMQKSMKPIKKAALSPIMF